MIEFPEPDAYGIIPGSTMMLDTPVSVNVMLLPLVETVTEFVSPELARYWSVYGLNRVTRPDGSRRSSSCSTLRRRCSWGASVALGRSDQRK